MKKIFALILSCILSCSFYNFLFSFCYADLIEDELINKTLSKDLKIQNKNHELVEENIPSSKTNIKIKKTVKFEEEIPEVKTSELKPFKKVLLSDFSENEIPIKIKIKNLYTTKEKLNEGDYLQFETVENVKLINKNYKKGTPIKARIETISQNQIYGVPSDVIIGNFGIDNMPLSGEIKKIGANRAIWVYPLVTMGSAFFGLGLLFIAIRGGHAKIRPNQIYTVYYNYE